MKDVRKMIYSLMCVMYGNVEKLFIIESTSTRSINSYGKFKLYVENVIKDYVLVNLKFKVLILWYFNVFGGDFEGVLGELLCVELREYGRIFGACFDAAMKNIDKFMVMGMKYLMWDGMMI